MKAHAHMTWFQCSLQMIGSHDEILSLLAVHAGGGGVARGWVAGAVAGGATEPATGPPSSSRRCTSMQSRVPLMLYHTSTASESPRTRAHRVCASVELASVMSGCPSALPSHTGCEGCEGSAVLSPHAEQDYSCHRLCIAHRSDHYARHSRGCAIPVDRRCAVATEHYRESDIRVVAGKRDAQVAAQSSTAGHPHGPGRQWCLSFAQAEWDVPTPRHDNQH
jgi:hypothetical protein